MCLRTQLSLEKKSENILTEWSFALYRNEISGLLWRWAFLDTKNLLVGLMSEGVLRFDISVTIEANLVVTAV